MVAQKPVLVCIAVLSIATVSCIAYWPILDYHFPGSDIFSVIESSIVESFGDFMAILSQRHMAGSSFASFSNFYRPVSSLSVSLDHQIWGLNPFGYQLTNLVIHALVAILTFAVAMILTGGQLRLAWISALVFALHPMGAEVVPEPARRQDMLAGLFILLALITFLRAQERRETYGILLGLSICFYALALGAKEVSVIFPVLVFGYLFTLDLSERKNGRTLNSIALTALRKTSPYLAVTVLFVLWRAYVVGGIGSYERASSFLTAGSDFYQRAFVLYLTDLIYPVAMHEAVPFGIAQVTTLIVIALIGLALIKDREVLAHKLRDSWASTGSRLTFVAALLVGFGSLIVLVNFPLIRAGFDHLIEQTYNGQGLLFAAFPIELNQEMPASYYQQRASELVVDFLLGITVLSLLIAVVICASKLKGRAIVLKRPTALTIFLVIWTLLPLALYLVVRRFEHWYMYTAVIPFSIGLSFAVLESGQRLARWLNVISLPEHSLSRPYISIGVFSISSLVMLYLVIYSPLFHDYGEWRESGFVTREVTAQLSQVLADHPESRKIIVEGLPGGVETYKGKIPRVLAVAYLSDYSLNSWFKVTHGDGNTEFATGQRTFFQKTPTGLLIRTSEEADGALVATIEPIY